MGVLCADNVCLVIFLPSSKASFFYKRAVKTLGINREKCYRHMCKGISRELIVERLWTQVEGTVKYYITIFKLQKEKYQNKKKMQKQH